MKKNLILLIIFTSVLSGTFLAIAANPTTAGLSRGEVLAVRGEAQLLKAGASGWALVQKGVILHEGDTLKTAKDSEATLLFSGMSKIAEIIVRGESEFKLETFRHDEASQTEKMLLNVETGSMLVKAEKLSGHSKLEVKTPASIVGVRGTVFEAQVTRS